MNKTFLPILLVFLGMGQLDAQPQNTPYSVVDEGANYRVWAQTNYVTGPDGQPVPQVQSYTELQTGMHYPDPVTGQWLDSKAEIDPLSNDAGAAATNAQFQAYFPPEAGEVEVYTIDKQWLRSEIIGIFLYDQSTGKNVMIGQLTNSPGILEGDNVADYTNAFSGVSADINYVFTLAGLEQNVVIQGSPPSPADVGLNPNSTLLEVETAFQAPEPTVTEGTNIYALPDSTLMALPDDTLNFGAMQMAQGQAFVIGTNSSSETPVSKEWIIDGQTSTLIESVPWAVVASELTNLPASPQVSQAGKGQVRYLASSKRVLPGAKFVKAGGKSMKRVGRATSAHGYCMDYQILNAAFTNFTFRCDTTYYISGLVTLSGNSNVWQGGSVLKFANTNSASISLSAVNNYINQTGPYLPCIFTAQDDNSVGSQIPGSTGVPTNYYANPALSINSAMNVSHLRIAYANTAIKLGSFAGGSATISDSQFVNCGTGISMTSSGTSANVQNALFAGVGTDFSMDPGAVTAVNATFANTHYLTYIDTSSSFYLTNCILANVTNLYFLSGTYGGDHNGFYNAPSFGTATNGSASNPFQTAGAGNYYLTNGCAFIGAATTNIGPALLADLATKTVYPPLLLSNQVLPANTNLNPQAQRDTGTPSLGYAYDPIDCITDQLVLTNKAQLSAANGVVIACYNNSGILLTDGAGISSIGTALYPDWFVQYQSVQEEPISLDGAVGNNIEVNPYHATNAAPTGLFQFTKFAGPAGSGNLLYHTTAPTNYSSLTVQDCEFWGGSATVAGSSNSTAILDNNLFYQNAFSAPAGVGANNSLSVSNNLLEGIGPTIHFAQPAGSVWYAFNNVFDTCSFGPAASCTNGYNGYINCTTRINPVFGGDISNNAFAWQTGPLGNFYQPNNSGFIGLGSTTVAGAGLTGYTVLTNQTPDTNPVALGYHYFAPPVNSMGTDFWVAFFYMFTNPGTTNDLSIYICSASGATGIVTIPGLAFTNNFSVAAGGVTNISIPFDAMDTYEEANDDEIETNGIHVTASQPVSVYGFNYDSEESTAFTGYPTPLLGTNYCVIAYTVGINVDYDSASELTIVATENNTRVTITPSTFAFFENLTNDVPFTTNLNQGETWDLLGDLYGGDVTGTWITSDEPIAVVAGAANADVPNGNSYLNPLMQEQLPVDSWGTEALALSFAGRTNGDVYRVLAAYSNTVVTISGTVDMLGGYGEPVGTTNEVVVVTNQAGQSCDIMMQGPALFQGSQPIQVAHFSIGAEWYMTTNNEGDPCEILLPPTGRYLQTNIVFTPVYNTNGTGDFNENYITVIAPWSATNSIYVDHTLVPATNFMAIGNSGYYGAQLPLTNSGSHTVTGSQPVGVEVYGWGYHDAYGYFGGVVQ